MGGMRLIWRGLLSGGGLVYKEKRIFYGKFVLARIIKNF